MSLFPIESRLVGAAIETTPGTPETLLAPDYDVRAFELSLSSLEQEFDDSTKYATGDNTRSIAVAGIATGGIDVVLKLAKGAFEYDTAALTNSKLPYAKYFNACGLKTAVSVPTDELTEDGYWEFSPNLTANLQTVTGAVLDVDSQSGDAVEYSMYGMMGTLVINMETGKPYNASISLSGGVSDVVDILAAQVPEYSDANALSSVPEVLLDTVVRLTELNADGSIKSGGIVKEFCIETGSLDTGVTVSAVKCQASSSGILYYTITSHDPKVVINPRLEKIVDFDFWGSLSNEKTWMIEFIGTDIEISVPRAQMIASSLGDTDGFASNELTFTPLRNLQGVDHDAKQAVYTVKIAGENTDITP